MCNLNASGQIGFGWVCTFSKSDFQCSTDAPNCPEGEVPQCECAPDSQTPGVTVSGRFMAWACSGIDGGSDASEQEGGEPTDVAATDAAALDGDQDGAPVADPTIDAAVE